MSSGIGPERGAVRAADMNLGRELTGDLPCVVCRYNLRGLSIRSVCPECGTAIRATILAVVDPHARELRPIRWPRVVALGLMAWALGALGAALVSWWPHAARLTGSPAGPIGVWLLVCVGVSGLGALAFVRPHGGLACRNAWMALTAVAAYGPLGWVEWLIQSRMGGATGTGMAGVWVWGQDQARIGLSLIAWGLVLVILLGVRPNFRVLVARSLVLRTGRRDRQTVLAIGAAVLVAAAGDGLWLALMGVQWWLGEWGRMCGTILVATGSALVTLGAAGAVADCWRIARAIVAPSPTLGQVLGDDGEGEPGA